MPCVYNSLALCHNAGLHLEYRTGGESRSSWGQRGERKQYWDLADAGYEYPQKSQHIAASVKHFACNNKESNRKDSDSRVSERALREIYLKGFEIVVKESDPWTIMSSYNLINGHRASENKDLLTGILREEWGFKGIVTTDWWTRGEYYKEAKAGNDIKMGCGYPDRLIMALEKGLITREEIKICAKRILEMILKLD